ncbi:hypothetical protein [Lacrimispora sp.]|uniref:hypothetical protein n=1 Tax=Lacrimispora sp. TaxID=2719234 RepID=UPI0032E3EADA
MELEMKEDDLTVKDYQRLRASVGWSILPKQQIETALKNSLITITVRDQEQGFRIRPSDNRGAGMEMILPVHQDTGA